MEKIIIVNYNNYFNRILKKLDSVADYAALTGAITISSINFNPADGVDTTLILGKGTAPYKNWEVNSPDYLIVYKTEDNSDIILSRWFITDIDRTRGGQWNLILKRDVLVDFGDAVETAPIYVEKGIINDIDSPLLCNNESLTVNQIKSFENVLVNGEAISTDTEVLLKDKSACPWLVMYLKKGILGNRDIGTDGKITVDVPNNVNIYKTLSTPITSWSYYQYSQFGNIDYKYNSGTKFLVYFKSYQTPGFPATGRRYTLTNQVTTSLANDGDAINYGANLSTDYLYNLNNIKNKLDSEFKDSSVVNTMMSQATSAYHYNRTNPLIDYNDKIIKDSNGKYFTVRVYQSSSGTDKRFITTSEASALKNTMATKWNDAMDQSVTPNDKSFRIEISYVNYRIELIELTDVETTIDFANYAGTGTVDSPLYDIIAMPYGTLTEFVGWEVSKEFTTSKERSMTIMNNLAAQLSSQYVLDLQVLPYCPVQDVLNDYYDEEGKIAIIDDAIDTLAIYGGDLYGATDVILVCPRCQDITFNIEKSIEIVDNSDVPDTFKRKYLNDCVLFRLCSPNYNGLFEFNIAKNGGAINRFNVDLTLKPYNPYIHVNPDFNFLYGYDFNDIRGLICGGDFSLGTINDAWVQYEIQNKNYQAIFDRQIQNLDINNAITKQEAGWQMAAGTLQGTVAGAAGGAMVGGGWGAAAGAVVGLGSSLAGGLIDLANLDKRQAETRDYALDNYNLSLGNVRALPYSITKTSALTANNKLFPFVEIYECSEEEKEAYYAKLKYDGMTVGRIDTIGKYAGGENFFKGQVIRIPDLKDDTHIANAIKEEIMKGVYI